jgi:RNA polymerase sigma-70 factor (ECF subfamily)
VEPKTGVDPRSLLEHKGFVRGIARGLLADEHAAEDVLQETWLRAIRRPPRHAALRAWLGRVGRNLALTAMRAQGRRGLRERASARAEAQPSASEAAARLEQHRLVVEAVLALEEPFRSAILLRFYEDLPPREIARELGVPVDTVRSRLRRGLERLRAWFDARHGGDRAAWSLALLPIFGVRAAVAGGTRVLAVEGAVMSAKAKLVGAAIVVFAAAAGTIAWQAARARNQPAPARTETRHATPAAEEPVTGVAVSRGEIPEVLPDRGIGPPAPGVSLHKGTATEVATFAAGPGATKPYRLAEPCGEPDRGALRVIVTDGAGSALAGARVLVGPIKGGGVQTTDYATDGAGRLEMRSLEPGKWSVGAISKGQHRIAHVEIEAGRFTEVAMPLAGGATVEGVVRHIDRGPLADVDVDIKREEAGFHDHFGARTDAQGRYRLESVPPGTHAVWLQGKFIGYEGRPRATLVVPGPGAYVRDFILGAVTLGGVVRDADTGAPLPAVKIRFQGPWWGEIATDADGAYGVPDLAPGNYKVCLTRDGYGTEFGETGPVTADGARTADFALRRAGILVLEVLDNEGRPITGRIDLGVMPVGGSTSLGTSLAVDASGVGRYNRIVPGRYDIDVRAEGYARQAQRAEIGAGESRLTFRLERDAAAPPRRLSLQGTVRDSATGRPIAGARISVQQPASQSVASTDADGGYRLFDVPAGQWAVVVGVDGYGVRFLRGVAFAAEPRALDIALDPGATLHLHVTDRAGRPVVGRIHLGVRGRVEGLTTIGTSVEADTEGHAVYKQIVPGLYDLRILQAGVGDTKVEVEILTGENVVRVRLE